MEVADGERVRDLAGITPSAEVPFRDPFYQISSAGRDGRSTPEPTDCEPRRHFGRNCLHRKTPPVDPRFLFNHDRDKLC